MHSVSAPNAMRTGRRASNSPAAHFLARAGLTARGVIYILIGWVAVLLALGHSTHEADQQGALQMLAGKSYGLVSLWLLGIGFAGYALWRLSEAAFGVTGEGDGAGPRLKSLGKAVVYASFAVLTFKVILGAAGSQTGRQQDFTAKVMHYPAGQWVVGIVGLASFWVQQRTRQIGIRRALGATRRQILRYFQTENFLLATLGIVIGMVMAYGINMLLMEKYELPRLPALFLPLGAVTLWLLGQIAVLGPALRAASVPPAVATRTV